MNIIEQANGLCKILWICGRRKLCKAICAQQTEQQEQKRNLCITLSEKVSQKETIDKSQWKSVMRWKRTGSIQKILKKRDFVQRRRQKQKKAKICGYLLRKGFRYEDIRQVIQVSEWNT